MKILLSFGVCLLVCLACQNFAWAGTETVTVSGKIIDAHGDPVSGADVYVYRTPNVKKPADFVSSRSGVDGMYQVVVPAGEFYLVAIFRYDGTKLGPLGVGDRHSGDPCQFEFSEDTPNIDFQVRDLREAALKNQKRNEDLYRLSGHLLDALGHPVSLGYAIADKMQRFKDIPGFFSAWSDVTGEYALFLPKGKYYLGGAVAFPPAPGCVLQKEFNLEGDMTGIDIVLHCQ